MKLNHLMIILLMLKYNYNILSIFSSLFIGPNLYKYALNDIYGGYFKHGKVFIFSGSCFTSYTPSIHRSIIIKQKYFE